MNKKWGLPVVLVAGALALALALGLALALLAWQTHRPQADPDTLRLFGNVDIRQVSLAFNASERIEALTVQEGDRVRAGDLLGRLDLRTTRLRLAQAEAQIGVQQQALARLQAGARPEEIGAARANLAAADAQADLAVRQLARLQGTADATAGRGVSAQDLDSAAAHAQVARAQAASVRKTTQLVIKGPRHEDIEQAAQQLAATRAEHALIQRQLEESTLRAPVDAQVRARLMEPGDIASPQRPVYTLAITQPKWVRAYVAEPQLGRLRTGMAARVYTDSDPAQPIAATLGYIASVAEFTPKTVQTEELRTSLVYEVRFRVDDPQDRLRLGMPATVQLALAPAGAASAAPP